MSARDVADMLALAHRGFTEAASAHDENMRRMSVKLVSKALQHPDAAAFFGGLQLALAEIEPFGNDPDIDDNGDGVMDPEENDDVDAGSPAAEGLTDSGQDDDMDTPDNESESTDDNDQNNESMESGVVTAMRPLNVVGALASNFSRLNCANDARGVLLTQVFKTREGADKRSRFENANSHTHRYTVEKTGDNSYQLRKVGAGKPGKW